MHERYVNHRALVNDKRVARELILLVLAENDRLAVLGHFRAEHAVDGGGLHAAQLTHALCRAPGGGSKVCFKLKLVVHGKHGFEYGRFSRAGAAGYDQHSVFGRQSYRLALHGGIINAVCCFKAVDKCVNIHLAAILCAAHGFDPVGGISLGLVKVRKIAGVKPCNGTADYLAGLAELIHRILGKLLRHAYQLRGCRRELSARNEAMAVSGIMHKFEHNGGAYAV